MLSVNVEYVHTVSLEFSVQNCFYLGLSKQQLVHNDEATQHSIFQLQGIPWAFVTHTNSSREV